MCEHIGDEAGPDYHCKIISKYNEEYIFKKL